MTCRVCNTPTLPWLDMGEQPLANGLRWPDGPAIPRFPLAVERCPTCALSQLSVVVPREQLYDEYPYQSGMSETFRRHCDEIAAAVVRYGRSNPRALDIASNDGTLIDVMSTHGIAAFGVEPSQLADGSTIRGYFPEATAALNKGQFDAVTSLNVLGHVDDVHAFAAEVSRLLARDGIWLIEVPYLRDLLVGGQFDTIYHEHLSYWTLTALDKLLRAHDLAVVEAHRLPLHGGSLKVIAQKGRACDPPGWVETDLLTSLPYARFERDMRDRVARFWDWRLKRDGTWGAFGASAKGAIFASVMGLSHESLRYVVDETPTKIGRITPYGVPIVPLSRLIDVPVDRLLCLTWNFIDEVRRKVAALGVETIVEVAP